jgi:hypothetical protein
MIHFMQGFWGAAKEPHEGDSRMNVCGSECTPSSKAPATRLICPVEHLLHSPSLRMFEPMSWMCMGVLCIQ